MASSTSPVPRPIAPPLAARCPIGRPGVVDELCGQLLLFSSDACSYTTGQTIYIDGGWTCV